MTKQRKRLINFLAAFKAMSLVVGASAYISDHEHITFWVLVLGAGLDETIKFIKKDIQLEENESI